MILKYRGYNQNWCYVEAPFFTVTTISDLLDTQCIENSRTSDNELRLIEACHNEAIRIIREKTGHDGTITFLIGNTDIRDLHECTVVIFDNIESRAAYVLCKEAYLMTDRGQTIERIA